MDSRAEQVIATHSSLIVAVAQACGDPQRRGELEPILQAMHDHGRGALVARLRALLDGRRDLAMLEGLDADEHLVVERILRGLHDPATLPGPEARPNPAAAAPGLAAMVHTAAAGDRGAMDVLRDMIEQMHRVGGDMSQLGQILLRLLQGERNPTALCAGTGALCQSLVLEILHELAQLDRH